MTTELIDSGDEVIVSMSDEIFRDARRYRIVRKMNPRQFSELYKKNISTGVHFDYLVDEIGAKKVVDTEKPEA